MSRQRVKGDRYARSVANGTLVVLGSGEIAPNMVRVYRELFDRLGDVNGVLLDSPYGFQENVPQLTEKILEYFSTSLQTRLQLATLTSYDRASELERGAFLAAIDRANFLFAGPGSPTYAMRQWGPLGLGRRVTRALERGATVSFSSAAALTLGRYTAPIYELYKVGDAPFWVEGLDVLSTVGLDCAVIPHFDNAEGGNHDTRFCYLGERRLLVLESLLESGVGVLGVDEHTAAIFHLSDDTVTVSGRGQAYWRTGGDHVTLVNGSTTPLETLRNAPRGARETPGQIETAAGDLDVLAACALSGGEDARVAVAELARRARDGGAERIDPTPLVERLLAVRQQARADGQYELSDQLRDALVAAGIEIADGPGGSTWSIAATNEK